jgi:outer membrane protein assembly factor BamA
MIKPFIKGIAICIVLAIPGERVFAQNNRDIDSSSYRNKRDLIDVFIDWKITDTTQHKPKRSDKKIRLSLLPSATTVPGASGFAFVTAFSAAFFLGAPQTTNLSNIYFTPYTNFAGKLVFPIRSYIWTKDNKWNFIGDYRYLVYPEYTYGLGSSSQQSDQSLVEYKHFRFHQSVLRNVFSYVVLGGGINLDYHYDITESPSVSPQKYVRNYEGHTNTSSVSNSLVLNAGYDSRQNSVNPQQGMYMGLVYRYTPTWLGSTSLWHSIYADIRTYHSFNPKRQQLISFWAFYWDVFSGRAPYLDMPATFWDPNYRAGRGYYQARFRGDAMAFLEAEYRFDLTRNGLWGATLFANAQTLRNPANRQFGKIAPAVGAGLRLKFNKYSNTNLTFDVGFGLESWNWFMGMGEYF